MEQKKKKQEDVLVVRDEKTGEISVVAGLDGTTYSYPLVLRCHWDMELSGNGNIVFLHKVPVRPDYCP